MQTLETLPSARTRHSVLESGISSRFVGKRIHFIGIGGCGMSGLARILLDAGAIVTGSDPMPNRVTMDLAARGVKITRDQLGELISPQTDLVVRTAAVKDDNLEFRAAVLNHVPHMKYAQMLGEVMQERLGVAVSGTHGKSTTTGMLAYALTRCGAEPSWVVGGTVPQLGGGSASGRGNAFVVEACEYDRSFHSLHPTITLINNVDADHLDCYHDIDDIVDSFRHFVSLVPDDGLVICNGQDERVARALSGAACAVQTVAVGEPATWTALPTGIVAGCHTGEIIYDGQVVAQLKLSLAGIHNLFNGTMALAAAVACGSRPQDAANAISSFTGVDRRMSVLGEYRGATVVDDYGHHPTEIRATLRAVREKYQPRKLYCVFQPHQYSRTRLLLESFGACFIDADHVLLPDIYACRDSAEDMRAVSSEILAQKIRSNDRDALYLKDFDHITEFLRASVAAGDLVLTIGAGNICEVGRELVDSPDA